MDVTVGLRGSPSDIESCMQEVKEDLGDKYSVSRAGGAEGYAEYMIKGKDMLGFEDEQTAMRYMNAKAKTHGCSLERLGF